MTTLRKHGSLSQEGWSFGVGHVRIGHRRQCNSCSVARQEGKPCAWYGEAVQRGKKDSFPRNTARRMERHGSCSAWDEDDMMADDMMAEALTRSASAAQREARESDPSQTS